MKITALCDIEQVEKVYPLDKVMPFDSTYAAIKATAQRCGQRTALSFFLTGDLYQHSVNVSYEQLLGKITQSANLFHHMGLGEDDVMAFILPNLPETHYVIWGGEAACQVLAINPLLEPQQIKELLNSAKAKVLVTMNPMPKMDLWQKVETILPELESVQTVIGVDIAHYVPGFNGLVASVIQPVKRAGINLPNGIEYINFTSAIKKHNRAALDFNRTFINDTISSLFCTGGTTGLPKMAMRSHRNELVNAMSVIQAAEGMLGEAKTILCGLPLFHVNGTLITGLIPFIQGATVVMVTPQGYRGDRVFPNFWKIVDHFKVNTFSGVPTVYSALLQQPVGDSDLSSLDFCMCGAAPMPIEIFKSFESKIGVKILEGYGLTEGTCVSSINPTQGETRVGSIGIRIPYQQMMCGVIADDGTVSRCQTNEVGAVLIQGDNVFKGYKESHQNQGLWLTDSEGLQWLNTGDLGRQDEDGYFWLTGRKKELIIRGGHNIEPKIIEEVMCTHPAVSLAAAVGRPDAHSGEVPVCYVQLTTDSKVTTEALLEFAQANVAERAAIPKAILVMAALPTTAVGKIFKPALEMKEIEGCIKTVIERLLPDSEYHIDVAQHRLHGVLATIKIAVSTSTLTELKAELGLYTFKFDIVA